MSAILRPYDLFALQALVTCIASVPRVGKARFVVTCAIGTVTLGWTELSLGAAPGLPHGLDDWAAGVTYRASDAVAFGAGPRFYLALVDHTAASGQTPEVRPDLWALGASPGAKPIPPGATLLLEAQIGFANLAGLTATALELDSPVDFSDTGVDLVDLQVRRFARAPMPVIDAQPGVA
jgi:hypothetical protein